jgi:hypothetical protein
MILQTNLESGFLRVENQVFPTLLAISEEEQSRGLMHQKWPPPIMSFVYSFPKVSRFWMKNTPSPLDIVFCCEGKITQIHKGEPFSTSTIGDYSISDLVVEFPYGTVKGHNIKIGDSVSLLKPDRDQLKKIFAQKQVFFKI